MSNQNLPAHKLIPGTGFIVDGFKYKNTQIKQYFLSHAHADHYTGLRENWDYGLVNCNEMTGKLVVQIVGIDPAIVRGHKMDTPVNIDGVEVIFVDANHCPGAAQILFRLPTGETYIHCGDMRFGPHLLENPHLNQFRGCNAVFLDTTYCNAKYTFPPQEEAVEYIASFIERTDKLQDGKKRLFLIQTYVIGKERILIEVSKRTGKKLFISDKKLAIMKCIDMPGLDISDIFTVNPDSTNIHLTQWGWLGESWPFFRPNFKNMETAHKMMAVDEVIGFCPTGWMYEMKKSAYPVKRKGASSIHLVPYSEHSSYAELKTYVQFLKPHKVIPTVGVEGENAERNLRSMLKHFRNLVDENASKANFLAAFKGKQALNTAGSTNSSTMSDTVKSEQEAGASDAKSENGNETVDPMELDSDAEQDQEESKGHAVPMEDRQPDGNESVEELEEFSGMAAQRTAPSDRQNTVLSDGGDRKFHVDAAGMKDEGPGDHGGVQRSDEQVKQALLQEVKAVEKEETALHDLLAVLGESITKDLGAKLLKDSKGDVQSAVNAFYDRPQTSKASNIKAVPQARSKRQKGSAKATPGSQKKAAVQPDQKSIMSFFGQNKRQKTNNKQGIGQSKSPEISIIEPKADTVEQHSSHVVSLEQEEEPQDGTPKAPPRGADSEPGTSLATPTNGKRKLVLPPMSLVSSKTKEKTVKTEVPVSPDQKGVIQKPSGEGPTQGKPKSKAIVKDKSSEVPWDAVLKGVKEYDPVKLAIWEEACVAPYLHVARALQAMESTTKRLRISDVIANMFRSLLALSPDDILPAAYLVTGKVAPDYEGIEMNVGGSVISQAAMEATGVTRQKLSTMYRELGDLGDVVQACRHNQSTLHKPAPLSIKGVFKTFKQIASEKGNGSALRKQRAVMGLLRSAREEEPKYLVRTLISNLRVGANWRSVIPGLARAFVYHEKGVGVSKAELDSASAAVSDAFHQCPNLDLLIQALRDGGLEELHRRCTLKAGVPLKPMLAKICEGIPDALRQLKGEFLAEFKYDGTRSQIHLLPDGSVKLFSRNCEDKTVAYPDVVETIKQAASGGARELVMDAEFVGVDRDNDNRLRAFQELSTRARGQTEIHQVSVNVCVFVFDILMVDGDVLLKSPLRERRARVAKALPNMRPGFIQLAESIQLTAPSAEATEAHTKQEDEKDGEPSVEAQVNTYLLESFAAGVEGLMLKPLDVNATYQASKRSENWLKLKRDYCEGLRDSLDLVPIGAWWGQGRKTGWFSPFLMAAWDPEKEEFQSVCRCMSGFTDVFYTEATERLKARMCERKSYYNTGESCSVWFEPGEVWEIRGADLTISPVHRAAIGCIDANPERGVSLRFPRHIRVREDKTVDEATSPDVIVDLYNKQTRKMSSAKERLEAQKQRDSAEDAQEAEQKSEEDVDEPEVT